MSESEPKITGYVKRNNGLFGSNFKEWDEPIYTPERIKDPGMNKQPIENPPVKFAIPQISNDRLEELYAQIKPLCRHPDGTLWCIEKPDLRGVAYTWSPKYTERSEQLRELGRSRTLHTYGYYGMFKPSVAEVLAQLPVAYRNAIAFELIGPSDANELNEDKGALNAGFHVATAIFYSKL